MSTLNRPMFMSRGGGAFPDVSGDGQITQKDILMARGVIPQNKNMGGMMRKDERTIRNVDDEIYRIAPKTYGRGRERMDAREEYARDLREKDYLRSQMNRLAAGGPPMTPAMMAPPPAMMAPPMGVPPEAQVQVTEQAATAQGEQLGQEYLNEMMTGLDTAGSTEEVIDAIRGNDKTLQQRYDELANFVGEADSSATPESVLALVQPTIMLTEQGAMDSGIGELMQGIAGEVEMETEMGAPTPMGQGVGELMVSQSVEEMVPQMNAGGPVQYFDEGGGAIRQSVLDQFQNLGAPSTTDQFSEMVDARLPVYQQLLGDTDQTKKDLQSKLYFDIAQAGLNLASGVDPRTGQSMAGRSLGSQLASAAQPVAASAGAAAQDIRNVERAAAAGALQSAESAEAARIAAERGLLSDLYRGALNESAQQGVQDFTSSESALNRDLTRTEGENTRDFQERLANQQDTLTRDITDIRESGLLERLNAEFGFRLEELDTNQRNQLLRDTRLNDYDRARIKTLFDNEESLTKLQSKLRENEIRTSVEGQLGLQDDQQLHSLEIQKNTINQRESEFIRNFERLLENDDFKNKFTEQQFVEMKRQFQATAYNTRREFDMGLKEQIASRESRFGAENDFFGTGLSIFDLNKAAQEFGFDMQERALQLKVDNQLFQQNYNNANQRIDSGLSLLQQELLQQQQGTRQYQAITDRLEALSGLQTDYSKIFGSSREGIMQGLLTDQLTLDLFARGKTSPDVTNRIITSIEQLSRPKVTFNEFGQRITTAPMLPSNVVDAARQYEANFGPMIGGSYNQGGPVRKFQNGGGADLTEFERRMQSVRPPAVSQDPISQSGMIVDETLDFQQATGVPAGFKSAANVAGDTLRDITGIGAPPFPEVGQVQEQLKAISNMTQRFIRSSSVDGRPFAVEIEALAMELAQPGALQSDERNLTKLQTMRTQLQELENVAKSVLAEPAGFDRKMVLGARQDLSQLGPLLDNFDKVITSYERGLGKLDKPDPAMFERGLR